MGHGLPRGTALRIASDHVAGLPVAIDIIDAISPAVQYNESESFETPALSTDAATMPPDNLKITWSSELSVGVNKLDEHHKNIINTFNKLLLAVEDAQADSEIVSDTLTKLTQYAVEHFREEESLLEQAAYPGIEDHRKEHQQFQEKIVQCCLAASIGVRTVPRELLAYLHDWLNHHLLEQDMKYKPFLTAPKVR